MRRGYVARDSPSLVVVLVVVVVAAMVVVVVEGLSPATVVALAPSLSLSTSSWPSFEARATTFFVVTSSRRSRLLLGDGGAIEGGRGRSSTRGWGGGVVGRLSRLVPPPPRRSRRGGRTTLLMAGGGGGREDEIRRKIAELRREGKLKKKDKPAEGDDEDGGGAAGVVSENVDSTTGTGGGASSSSVVSRTASAVGPRTSGVGGSWSPPPAREGTEDGGGGGGGEDAYQPKVGTWGAFPRPKNISVAYGGGKRVGAGIKTDEKVRQQSIDDTKERLRAYREKMGIEVQSEKDHVDVIEEALALAGRAMQRGSYGAGVSALEKVTRYCSTRSKLGGKVFLELAMAYEAEGRTDQAIGLYAALTKSPIEEVKSNADKLLYGLEAMNFMRNEAKLEDFSRKKVAETFIETTGFNDISKNFDKVYNTAYIDLDKGGQYYRMLTANAVRSTREARQILLRAVSSGEVENMKVVQAVRSITRSFDEAVTAERKDEEANNVPVDYAGKPIVSTVRRRSTQDDLATAIGMDGYVLSKPSQTLDNLDGEWRLQLMADKRGDRVEYFNSTLFWQRIDSSEMKYAGGSGGIRSSSQSGVLDFDEAGRILSRAGVSTNAGGGGGGGMGLLSMIMGGGGGGTAREMIKAPQQVMLVDSALLVTRAIVKAPAADNVKDYFSVWRRVESGTYSGGS
ncbi:hypothetical protein ACHAW5_010257 [Stephanodiscus triporus]|uniref:Uncharacterized protein n=1 Tax=Stephanodiscus triporus TaxID=2934178 RepID=A0ABD3N3P8_9STRA